MADTSPERGRWASHPVPPEGRSIVELIGDRVLDGELAATTWLLLEGRVPLLVARSDDDELAVSLLRSLLDLLPSEVARIEVAGAAETFDWLPQASELGWPGNGRGRVGGTPVRAADTVLIADLSDGTPASTWGEAARLVVRAATIGYGLAATVTAGSLDEMFAALGSPSVRLTDDELARLGTVLVVGDVESGRHRVVAAHYLRPVARDAQGHIQRLGPGVLATWDPVADGFEHFGWGITPELAARVGMRPGDFELEVAARRELLDGLVAAGLTEPAVVRSAAARHRTTSALTPGITRAASTSISLPH